MRHLALVTLLLAACSTSPSAAPDTTHADVVEEAVSLADNRPGPDWADSDAPAADLTDARFDLDDAVDLRDLSDATPQDLKDDADAIETVDVVDFEPLPPYEATEFIGTDGRHFRDTEGRVLLLHGLNASNVSKHAPFFPSWLTEEHVDGLAARGINVVRFLVIWEAIEPEKGAFDQDYLDMVEEKVAWFTERGIYVLIDMHQDIWGPKYGGDGAPLWATIDHDKEFDPPPGDWFLKYGEPAVMQAFQSFWDNEDGIRDHFVMAWQEVAKRFVDNPMVVGYDIINEPFLGNWDSMKTPQFEAEELTPFYTVVAAGIREVDENHIIFVEPTATKGLGIKGGLGPIGDDKVAYAAHYYHPTMDLMQMYSDSKENMLELFTQIRDEADVLGGPTFLGEFGFYAGFEGAEEYARHQLEVMEELGMSWSIWSFDKCQNGFCLLNSEGAPLWPLEYITQTWPQRVAGRILDWHYDRPTRTMTLTFDPEGVAATETVVFVPQQNYPLGIEVACSTPESGLCDATFDAATSRVVATVPAGSAGTHTLTVSPATPYAAPAPSLSTHTSTSNLLSQEQEYVLEEELGLTVIRTDFKWSKMEKVEGQFTFEAYDALVDNALAHGIEFVAILDFSQDWAESEPGNTSTLDPAKFAAFAGAAAAHFADRIDRYEIWNEQNIDRFWKPKPDPAAYAKLLKAATIAIRENDPTATVIYGGLASTTFMESGTWPFLFETLHVQPDLGHYFDQLSIHPYTLAQSLSPEQPNAAGTFPDSLAEARAVLAKFGYENKPIVLTEMGWPACPCPPLEPPVFIPNVTYEQQAAYLVRSYLWSWAQGIGAYMWYDFFDGSGNAEIFSEDYFGLLTYDADTSDGVAPDKKPSFHAYQALIELTAGRTFGSVTDPADPCTHVTLDGPEDTLHVLWKWNEKVDSCPMPEDLTGGETYDINGNPTTDVELGISPVYVLVK